MVKEYYEINNDTCALIPNADLSTKIIEENKTISVPFSINEILNYSCNYYGSSFKGRLKGSKYVLGSKYKLPIIVEESREIIFFPTLSYENKDCIWLSLNNISNFENKSNKVSIIFTNGLSIDLNISYKSLENQILRATKLLLILKSRKK